MSDKPIHDGDEVLGAEDQAYLHKNTYEAFDGIINTFQETIRQLTNTREVYRLSALQEFVGELLRRVAVCLD